MGILRKLSILFILLFTSSVFLFSEEMQSENLQIENEIESQQKQESVHTDKAPSTHEIYLGYGYPNSIGPFFVGGIQNLFSILLSAGQQSTEFTGYGVAQIGYNWFCIPSKGLSVGGILTLEPYSTTYIQTNSPENNRKEQSLFSTIQATVKYQYGWKYVRLYHGLSMGLGLATIFSSENVTSPMFIFNVIPIGVKIGKEQGVNFFADIGFGSTSIINMGASYRF